MIRIFRWLRARWRYIAAAVIGLVLGLLVRRRKLSPEAARALGRAQTGAGALASDLRGEAADLQREIEAAEARDIDADRERAAAARRAVADADPDEMPTIRSVRKYMEP